MNVAALAAELLKQGNVVACPTDTVYGLLADATNEKAVRKVFLIKGRAKKKPLSIFVENLAMAHRLAKISPEQERFLKKAWPGKVTAVLSSKGMLPLETGTRKKIGLRIPKHRLIRQILKIMKKPLTGTSANISGLTPCRSSKEVEEQFRKRKHKPDHVVEGAILFFKPSAVVDITGKTAKILRK